MLNPQPDKKTTPVWLSEEPSDEDVQPLNVEQDLVSENTKWRIGMFMYSSRFITMALCSLMAATALVGLSMINGVENTGRIFVAIYMLFFSFLLFAFEFNKLRPVQWIDHMFLRNFGFLYSAMGKSLYIIFIAFLSFGLGEPQGLSYISGFCLGAFGSAELALYLKYPEFFGEK